MVHKLLSLKKQRILDSYVLKLNIKRLAIIKFKCSSELKIDIISLRIILENSLINLSKKKRIYMSIMIRMRKNLFDTGDLQCDQINK